VTTYEIRVMVHEGGKTVSLADLSTESPGVAAQTLRAAAGDIQPPQKAAPVYRGESGEHLPKAEVPRDVHGLASIFAEHPKVSRG
jgi:hypothetical protein